MSNMTKNQKGSVAYKSTGDMCLDVFSKAGSASKEDKKTTSLTQMYMDAWKNASTEEERIKCLQLLMWIRNCRGGAGNRKNFRDCLTALAKESPKWVASNIKSVTEYGRWDDLTALYDTPCEKAALEHWAAGIQGECGANAVHLAAKWAGRQDSKLRSHMGMSPKSFRKHLVARTGWTVEMSMCAKEWDSIEYSKVPSVAMMRNNKAFAKHSPERYEEWKEAVAKGDEKVNVSVTFPHDVVRMMKNDQNPSKTTKEYYDRVFSELPDYITTQKGSTRIMPICDFSGSMGITISGSITALDVSLALGLYCTSRLNPLNPFYKTLIPFSDESTIANWKDQHVWDACRKIPDGYCGSTNIVAAFEQILNAATKAKLPQEEMIDTVLILSDMQWDGAVSNWRGGRRAGVNATTLDGCIDKWKAAGYTIPRVVLWDLSACTDSAPAAGDLPNSVMISGYSPAVLKGVLGNTNITPLDHMNSTLGEYPVVVP